MTLEPKEIVRAFYDSSLNSGLDGLKNFLHEDCELNWNSSKGYNKFNYDNIVHILNDIKNSYESVRFQISHLLQDGNFVTTRYTLYVHTIENPSKEVPLAHYITIWEVKDGKLFLGHEISQLADDSVVSLNSFSKIKV